MRNYKKSCNHPKKCLILKIMEDVIENGMAYDAGNNSWNIEKCDYRVVVIRDDNQNWILSAFNHKTSKKGKPQKKIKTVVIEKDGYETTLALTRNGDKERWLLSDWEGVPDISKHLQEQL